MIFEQRSINLSSPKDGVPSFEGASNPPSNSQAVFRDERLNALLSLYTQGRPKEVLTEGEKLRTVFPNSFVLMNILGAAESTLGNYEEACSFFKKALQINPQYFDAIINYGHILNIVGRTEEALACYRKALEIQPNAPELYNSVGNCLTGLKRFKEAQEYYQAALKYHPNSSEAHYNLGVTQHSLKAYSEALVSYQKALHIQPDMVLASYNLGLVLQELKRPEEALLTFSHAVDVKKDFAEAHSQRGILLQELGRHEEAILAYSKAIQFKPDHISAYNNMGVALRDLGRQEEAIIAYKKAIHIKADYVEAHNNLGVVLKEIGQLEEAVAAYQNALKCAPTFYEGYFNLALTLQKLGRYEEAISAFTQAISIKPDYVEALNNLGNLFQELRRFKDAIAAYQKALEKKPNYADVYNNLGVTFKEIGNLEQAKRCFFQVLKIDPQNADAHAHLFHLLSYTCDWETLQAQSHILPHLGISGKAVSPFSVLSLEDHPARHRARSEQFCTERFTVKEMPTFPRPQVKPDKIRVGYFSPDFRDHVIAHLVVRLFELHDRARFHISAFAYGPPLKDTLTERIQKAVPSFFDVRNITDRRVAELAREQKIDIAIDLAGYTTYSRSGIFAHRTAPIQISYLGYPGTMGAPFIDYLIADPFIIPTEQRKHYSEKIIYLPHHYLVSNDRRKSSDRLLSRRDVGLPDGGFVFCCFNSTYKIMPEEFNIWMNLLHHVQESVLWLQRSNPWAEENLKKEALKRGITPQRLIFAERTSYEDYLQLFSLADLFLDTFYYNANATANDALWVGLPVLTKAGRGLIARACGSLLKTLNLSELITTTTEDYFNRARDLALHQERLLEIKTKLQMQKNISPLFNTELCTAHLEKGYEAAYDFWLKDISLQDIEVK